MNPDPSSCCRQIDRRGFVQLAAAAAALVAAGCETTNPAGKPAAYGEKVIDAGPASAYAKDGVYSQFHAVGFFIVQRDGHLTALSSICTHRNCKLEAEADRTFYCPWHGSTFGPEGKVTHGPANRDLPAFATSTDAQGHLLVHVLG